MTCRLTCLPARISCCGEVGAVSFEEGDIANQNEARRGPGFLSLAFTLRPSARSQLRLQDLGRPSVSSRLYHWLPWPKLREIAVRCP